jgi:hypothetical protein
VYARAAAHADLAGGVGEQRRFGGAADSLTEPLGEDQRGGNCQSGRPSAGVVASSGTQMAVRA